MIKAFNTRSWDLIEREIQVGRGPFMYQTRDLWNIICDVLTGGVCKRFGPGLCRPGDRVAENTREGGNKEDRQIDGRATGG